MKAFGAKEKDFEIRVNMNSKKFSEFLKDELDLKEESLQALMRIIDKKEKVSSSEFKKMAKDILGAKTKKLENILDSKKPFDAALADVLATLSARGVKNARFYPSLVRGFEYYTGIIFEVFDTNKENPRALFGGGRYDELLDIFGVESIPAVGFGMGDVTIKDYLETHKLLPEYAPKTEVYVCAFGDVNEYAEKTAMYFRQKGVNTAVDMSAKKIGAKIKNAVKLGVPYIVVIGEDEAKSGALSLKALKTEEEWKLTKEESVEKILSRRVV
jgi:histidyl-tRNA synthetase